ncbi:3-oxoacyl-[acyl-carrier-protein] synthase II [Bacillus thermophilus]|uniref:3-oxoacyl-[acyl-carrier-protein] synthase II n=1 Tax=Siminovitchia thermophila TaxID=1245522 RepID=A0ABS2R924_9BACI|nr:beta-ketoacyl synthase N-terminal-like domain-containing protein [Siminovitchia thermophila]MBM7716142.1 3-oxoacyl-[acyl-carrier-protein] synthase II [Siminovitchia thermophila]ONK21502.1 hypothetical protein BLX87_21875 [Bacillus sp. VT-16-64]
MSIVITGMGAVTHLGIGQQLLREAIVHHKDPIPDSWISEELQLALTGFRVDDEQYKELLSPYKTRNMDRFAKLTIAAVHNGLCDAKLTEKEDLETSGFIMSTTFGPWESTNRYTKQLIQDGPSNASPRLFPNTVLNSAQGHVCISFNIKGPTSTLTGLSAIPYAMSLLKKGQAERVIVAGADELNENMVEAYCHLGSSIRFGEGVGVLVLETLESAQNRNAIIYGEIGEYALGCEPSLHLWFEDIDPNSTIMLDLLKQIPLDEHVDELIVVKTSNGSEKVEKLEETIFQTLNDTYSNIEWHCPKEKLGETFGASSILHTISAVHLLNRNTNAKEALVLNNEIGGNHMALQIKKWNDSYS